jgi:hypothetical protein
MNGDHGLATIDARQAAREHAADAAKAMPSVAEAISPIFDNLYQEAFLTGATWGMNHARAVMAGNDER